MRSSGTAVGLVGAVLALGLLAFGLTLRPGSSEPRSGLLQDWPQAEKSAIPVSSRDDDTGSGNAPATRGTGTIAVAYYPVPETQEEQRWSARRPEVGTLGTSNDTPGVVAIAVVVGLEPTFTTAATTTLRAAGDSEPTLVVDGLVQSPLNLTFGDLVAMPRSTVYAALYCVGRPTTPLTEGYWTGVRLGLLLEEAGVAPEAIKVAFYADDGFTTDLTVATAMHNDIILAYERDGQPLTEELRLVVPGKWGYKWISGLTHIELVDYDFLGLYESRGHSDEADIPGYQAPAVGGVAVLPDLVDSPAHNHAIAVLLSVVAVVTFTAGTWYARRRWGR